MRRLPLPRAIRRAVVAAAALIGCGFTGPRVAPAEDLFVSPNVANYLRLYIDSVGLTDGRVRVVAKYTGGRNGNNFTSQSGERRESMRITINGDAPSVDYELSTEKFRVQLNLDDGNVLHVVREPRGDGELGFFEFRQPESGPITVTAGESGPTYSAPTIWHLLLNEPELADDVESLLRLLRPGLSLVSDAQAVEAALFKQLEAGRTQDREEWSALVAKLRSPRYVERVEADRMLRELGKEVVPFLRSFVPAQLDAEQAYRIRMIVGRYGAEARLDTPDSAAQRLADDPEIWMNLLKRVDDERRAQALSQLNELLGESVTYDATADEAVRQTQLAKIREKIEAFKKRPAR